MMRFTNLEASNRKRPLRDATLRSGLTLFELLIVLAILALLATLVAPRVIGYLGRAKSGVARTQISNIAASLDLFYLDVGRFPTTDESLTTLVVDPTTIDGWRGPYLKDESGLVDPWGRAYLYEQLDDGDAFRIFSYGRDGVEGGDDEDADIEKR